MYHEDDDDEESLKKTVLMIDTVYKIRAASRFRSSRHL
jgi:hypothetical protein